MKSINFIKFFFGSILIMLSLSACEDTVSVDLETSPAQLAVDGSISENELATVTLTLSQAYFDSSTPTTVNDAVVTLQGNGQSEQLQAIGSGIYRSINISGVMGNTYTITVSYAGEQYKATTSIKRKFDITDFRYYSRLGQGGNKWFYFKIIGGQEPKGLGDYYRVKMFVNGRFLSAASDISIANDQFVDGKTYTAPPDGTDIESLGLNVYRIKGDRLKQGEKVDVDLMSIDNAAYVFFEQLSNQSSGGLFSSPISNVKGNITNVNTSGKAALGLFYGSSKLRYTAKIDTVLAKSNGGVKMTIQ